METLSAAFALLVEGLGSSSVLILTTAGPTCLTICEKPLESATGEGMTRGFASEESTLGLLFTADVAREDGTGEDADRKCRKKDERRGEATGADAFEQGGGVFFGVSISKS